LVPHRPELLNTTPFIFAHPPLNQQDSRNDAAGITARQVLHIIQTYMKVAPDLRPEDVVVLLYPNINGSPVCSQLKPLLMEFYQENGWVSADEPGVNVFWTKSEVSRVICRSRTSYHMEGFQQMPQGDPCPAVGIC
jgi:hypothetical protein